MEMTLNEWIDFAEALKDGAYENLKAFEEEYGPATKFIAVDATIEALREMVGEPIGEAILVFPDPMLKAKVIKRYHIFCKLEKDDPNQTAKEEPR